MLNITSPLAGLQSPFPRRGAAFPYPNHIAAYDFGNAAGYVLNSGVETINNLGSGGATYSTTQATASARAALTSGALVADGVDDYYAIDALAGLIAGASIEFDYTWTGTATASNRTPISFYPASGSGFFLLQHLSNDRIRWTVRGTDNIAIWQHDIGAGGLATSGFAQGQVHRVRSRFTGGLLDMWNGDTQIVTAQSAPLTGGLSPTFTVATLCAKRTGAQSVTEVTIAPIHKLLMAQV